MHAEKSLCALRRDRPCASLHTRLIAGLLMTILAIWVTWTLVQVHQFSDAQTGKFDRMLRDVAMNILYTLPKGFQAVTAEPLYAAPPSMVAPTAEASKDRMAYQIWSADGRLMMRNPAAPADVPLLPLRSEGPGDTELHGEKWHGYAVLSPDGELQVMIAKPCAEMAAELKHWLVASLSTAALLFVALLGVVWLAIRWSLKPVERVRQALQKRDLHDETPLPTDKVPVELRPLIDTVNRTLIRLQRSLQTERRFLADAAHELRTPLAALRTQADVARQMQSPDETRSALDQLGAGIDRCARLSAQMLDMARLEHGGPAGAPQPVELSRLVDVVIRDHDLLAERRGLTIERELDAAPLHGHVDEIGILVRNLLDNAIRYGRDGGTVRVSCRVSQPGTAPAHAVLSVADDGPGIPPEERDRVFDRFYRAPGTRDSGSGIGLSLVSRVVAMHGARIALGPGVDGRGLGVVVHFPPVPVEPSAAATAPATRGLRWPRVSPQS